MLGKNVPAGKRPTGRSKRTSGGTKIRRMREMGVNEEDAENRVLWRPSSDWGTTNNRHDKTYLKI